jgi:hypothetical protein
MQQKDSPAIFLLEDIEVHAGAALLSRLHVQIYKAKNAVIIHVLPLLPSLLCYQVENILAPQKQC